MSKEEVTRLVHAWAAHSSSGGAGIERLLSLFNEDCVYDDMATRMHCEGIEELRRFVTTMISALPDHRLEITRLIAGDDGAGVEYIVTGTHRGDLPGMPATGKPFRFRGASVLTIARGRIQTCADYWDLLSSGIGLPRP